MASSVSHQKWPQVAVQLSRGICLGAEAFGVLATIHRSVRQHTGWHVITVSSATQGLKR